MHQLPLAGASARLAVLAAAAAALTAAAFASMTRSDGPLVPLGRDTAPSADYAKLPLAFEPNEGQTDRRVRFLARGPGYTLFLTDGGARLALDAPARGSVLDMRLVGAKSDAQVRGSAQLPGKANYIVGDDPAKWRTGITTYRQVTYSGVYPGIDLVYYGRQGRLEYDFVVAPGADPGRIALAFDGARDLELTAGGDLVLRMPNGEVRHEKPVVYQTIDGVRRPVEGRFVVRGDSVGFRVGPYDRGQPLVIDPVLVYSTFLGGGGNDSAHGIAVDGSGNAYVAGLTSSSNFPGASTALNGVYDAFVSKLDSRGATVLYSTYLGGAGDDRANDVAVDASGNAYLVGRTESADFPTANALQGTLAGNVDAFVMKLNADGSAPVYSTYLGGSGFELDHDYDFLAEVVGDVAVGSDGSAHVVGRTDSADFPTANAIQPAKGGYDDVFVAKLAPAGSSLVYSTYLGGSDNDGETYGDGGDIALGSDGAVYVSGGTWSVDFPTKNALRGWGGGGTDGFLTKIDAVGSSLVYSTYLGGSGGDEITDVAVDGAGNAYASGLTASFDFPTVNPYQSSKTDGFDGFLTKVDSSGAALAYSTYVGGWGDDYALGVAVDSNGYAYVAGEARCKFANADAYVKAFGPEGSTLVYGECLAGGRNDTGEAVAVGGGSAFVAGSTSSSGAFSTTPFPTTSGALQTTYGGGATDAFVASIGEQAASPPPPSEPPPPSADLGVTKTDAPDPVKLSRRAQVTYTIAVVNSGPDPAQAVTVTDALPAAMEWISTSTTQGTCSGTTTITCSVGTLLSGSSATVTIVVRPTALGTITNSASASSTTPDPVAGNNTATAQTTVVKRL